MAERVEPCLEAIALVKGVIKRLEGIPDGCAECFPFELIDELRWEHSIAYKPI